MVKSLKLSIPCELFPDPVVILEPELWPKIEFKVPVVISVPASNPYKELSTAEPEVKASPAFVPAIVFSSESELNAPLAAENPHSPFASTVRT